MCAVATPITLYRGGRPSGRADDPIYSSSNGSVSILTKLKLTVQVRMPWSHVRALSAEQAELFVNKRSEGMWKQAPPAVGGAHFRIINNTAICNGPLLAV